MSAAPSGGRVLPALPGDPSGIGPYRIIGRLGSGGMGTVHAGIDSSGTRVAVKVIHAAQAQDAEFRARFRREVQLSRRVQGPCLIPLLAADPDAAVPWLATAYTPGPTLNQHVSERGPLTGGMLYALATGTAQALAAIHEAGVVHRDVKPQNVVLAPAGPRVLDFGIAHAADGTSVTRTGVMTGTPGWISPEHYRTGTAGPAGDMFAWGALVAYAATGRLPFGAGAPDAVAFRVMSGEPDLDGVPAELRSIVEQALVKDPAERITAADAAQRCRALLAAQTTQALGEDTGHGTTPAAGLIAAGWDMPTLDDPGWHTRPARSRKRLYAVAVAAAVVIGGAAGIALSAATGGPGGRSAESGTATTADAPPDPADGGAAAASRRPRSDTGASTPRGTDEKNPAEATLDTWREARAPRNKAENDVHGAIGTGPWLDPDTYPDLDSEITFHPSRGEVYVATTGHELPSVAVQELARTACLGLRDLSGFYPDFTYREYVLVDAARKDGPSIVWEDDFRADTGCETSLTDRTTEGEGQATDWQPSASGLRAAQIPSDDEDVIRVADALANRIFSAWQGNSRITTDPDRLGHENMSVGFDPGTQVVYVWAKKPAWDRSARDAWGKLAARESCDALRDEAKTWAHWPYTRYAVLILDDAARRAGEAGEDFLRWGSVSDCAV
ncbi:serine/threonine-protein kinase [Streptomyces sp. NPDC052687]|uniref:serine/threonine-protein kinase n=1 Tax=Streptomyces sp. NPDC052687 TaxID=3154759 RepID=UPI00343DFD07